MHETSLIQNLILIASEALEGRNIKSVNRVDLSVGKLANALPDALVFAFEALTKGGVMEGAELAIKFLPIIAECGSCGVKYESQGLPIVCPECRSRSFRIVGGEEVFIESIDCEEGEST